MITKGTLTFNNQAHLRLDLQIYTKCISEETSYVVGIVTLTSCSLRYCRRLCALWLYERDIEALLNPSMSPQVWDGGLDPNISKALGKA